jgi:RHH-type rel operon transcriptional repressor/antitoxin RelB
MSFIRLDHETEGRLSRLAGRMGRSRSSIVHEALSDHLDDLEDGYIALERMRNPTKIHTSEEVKRDLWG